MSNSSFQKYEFQEIKTEEKVSSSVETYREPRFEGKLDGKHVDTIHKKADAFHLDRLVSGQLGIEDREKAAREERVRKEIERRWEQTAEKAEVAGYTRGLEEGKLEAFKAELPRVRERLEKLDHFLLELDKMRPAIFAANEAFVMELIAEVAGMVALREVELDKDYTKRLVMSLIHQLGQKDDLKIFLSPADAANITALTQAIEKEFGRLSNTTIETASELPSGGCRIETRSGVVDATLAAQLENVKNALSSVPRTKS